MLDENELQNRMNELIEKIIEEIVREEYQKIGYSDVKPMVGVIFQKVIAVYINSEDPFIESDNIFWKMIDRIKARIAKVIKYFGYVPVNKTKFFHDFLVLEYEFKVR